MKEDDYISIKDENFKISIPFTPLMLISIKLRS